MMNHCVAALADMRLVMNELARLDEVAALPGYAEATPGTVAPILEEAGKLATGMLDALNRADGRLYDERNACTPREE